MSPLGPPCATRPVSRRPGTGFVARDVRGLSTGGERRLGSVRRLGDHAVARTRPRAPDASNASGDRSDSRDSRGSDAATPVPGWSLHALGRRRDPSLRGVVAIPAVGLLIQRVRTRGARGSRLKRSPDAARPERTSNPARPCAATRRGLRRFRDCRGRRTRGARRVAPIGAASRAGVRSPHRGRG